MNQEEDKYPAVQFRIARPTNKIALIEEFYVDGLGLKKLYSFKEHAGYEGLIVGLPDRTYHLEFTQDQYKTPCPAPTKDNLLVLYFKSANELHKIKSRLDKIGIQNVEPENPYWKDKSYTYEDPDGWRIVLYNGTFTV